MASPNYWKQTTFLKNELIKISEQLFHFNTPKLEAYSEPCQISTMQPFRRKKITFSAKRSILDLTQGTVYASAGDFRRMGKVFVRKLNEFST